MAHDRTRTTTLDAELIDTIISRVKGNLQAKRMARDRAFVPRATHATTLGGVCLHPRPAPAQPNLLATKERALH